MKNQILDQILDHETLRGILDTCMANMQEKDCPETKTALADCYLQFKTASMNEEAVKLYRQAAEMGYAPAQCGLARCYRHGYGVEENIEKAFEWYRKAAEQDCMEAYLAMGDLMCHHHRELSFIWYQKAADFGDSGALYETGLCYELGRGTPVNFDRAKQCYAKAAEQGCITAKRTMKPGYWMLSSFCRWVNTLLD